MEFTKIVSFIGIIALAYVCCNNSGPSEEMKTAFDAGKWTDAWVKIWNTYDLNQVDRLFLQDDRLTYFSSEKEGALIGFESVREHHKGFGFVEGGKEQPNKLWLEDVHTTVFSSSVIVTGIWFFKRPDDRIQRGPITIVYVQQEDEYRIAHMSFSNYLEKDKESKY